MTTRIFIGLLVFMSLLALVAVVASGESERMETFEKAHRRDRYDSPPYVTSFKYSSRICLSFPLISRNLTPIPGGPFS